MARPSFFINIGVTWDRFLTLAIRPDIVLAAATEQIPSERPQRLLQFTPLHIEVYTNTCTACQEIRCRNGHK